MTPCEAREWCIRAKQILPDPGDAAEKKWAEEGLDGYGQLDSRKNFPIRKAQIVGMLDEGNR